MKALRRTEKSAAAGHISSHSGHKASAKAKKSHKLHGQQAIEASRVMEIQQALIREHYLGGRGDRELGCDDPGRHAEVPVRPGMADEAVA